jgi:hypothetical protein
MHQFTAIHSNHPCAFEQQTFDDTSTNALRSARDQRDFIVESHAHGDLEIPLAQAALAANFS